MDIKFISPKKYPWIVQYYYHEFFDQGIESTTFTERQISSLKNQVILAFSSPKFSQPINQLITDLNYKFPNRYKLNPDSIRNTSDLRMLYRKVDCIRHEWCNRKNESVFYILAKKYFRDETFNWNIEFYIYFGWFPLIPRFKVTFHKIDGMDILDTDNEGVGIFIHNKVSKIELRSIIDDLWPEMERLINSLPRIPSHKATNIDVDQFVYEERSKSIPTKYKDIKTILDNRGEYYEEDTLRQKYRSFQKKIRNL